MNALVISYNLMSYSFYFIQMSYPDEGLTALGRKRSIFYYNMLLLLNKKL